MKKLLFLGGPISQQPIIEKAKEMGFRTGVVDVDEKAPAREVADDFFRASILDCEAIFSIVEQYKPIGVTCGACDTPVQTAAAVCERFCLPGNSVETALKSTNKLLMLKAFSLGGHRIQSISASRKRMFPNLSRTCRFPLFLSPSIVQAVTVLI